MACHWSGIPHNIHDAHCFINDSSGIDSYWAGFGYNFNVPAAVDLFDLLAGFRCGTAVHRTFV